MAMKRQIVANLLSNYAGRAVGLILSFLIMPFLVAHLGVEAFGVIVFFESLVFFLESASEGFRIALSRYATFSLSRGELEETWAYLATGRVLLYALAAAVLVFGLPLSLVVTDLFRVPAGYEEQGRILFALLVVSFATKLPNAVYRSGLYAKQRYDLIHLAVYSASIVRAVLIFVLFSALPAKAVTLPLYGAVYLATSLAQNFFFRTASRLLLPGQRLGFSGFDRARMRQMLSFGFYTMLSHASSASHENLIGIFINLVWGPAYNAFYAIGMKFANLLESVFKEPIWSLTPTFTALAAQERKDRVEELLFLFTKGLSLVVTPICFFLMVYAGWIVPAWVGAEFLPAVPLMVLSLAPEILSIPLSACENFPNAYGKAKLPSLVNTLSVVLSLGLGYLLAVPGGMGLPGIALGTSVSTAAYCLFYLVAYACRLSGLSAARFWGRAYLPPTLWAMAFWGTAFYLVLRILGPSPLALPVVSLFIVLTAGYGLGSYFFLLDGSERKRLSEAVQSVPMAFWSQKS